MPSQANRAREVARAVLQPPVVPQRQAAGHIGIQPTPVVNDGVVERLQDGEAVADLGDVRPCLGGVVVDDAEHSHPAVSPGPGHGRIGAPAPVGRLGDDRAVVRAWLAPPTGPLRRQQAGLAEQPQHPLAADLDAALAAQPSPDLAITLAGERRVG
jgi:hypothetical protein